jgi:hypothetical protein
VRVVDGERGMERKSGEPQSSRFFTNTNNTSKVRRGRFEAGFEVEVNRFIDGYH